MKAVIFEQHGGPEVLKFTEVADPQIKANEVLVEVRACALNHLDVWVRGGLPGIKIPLPHILGRDGVGEVIEAGQGVENIRAGDTLGILRCDVGVKSWGTLAEKTVNEVRDLALQTLDEGVSGPHLVLQLPRRIPVPLVHAAPFAAI